MSDDTPEDIVDEPFEEDLDEAAEETGDESGDPGYVDDLDAQDEPRGAGPLVMMEDEEPELPPASGDGEGED